MDRLKQLESYTDRELVDELKRRFAVLSEAGVLVTGPAGTAAKNPKMSEAKAEYWRGWKEYRATHPDATVDQWRRVQKHSKRK